jgi:hypothetical protein
MTSYITAVEAFPESPFPFGDADGVFLDDSSPNDSFVLSDKDFLKNLVEGIERSGDDLGFLRTLNNQYCSAKLNSPAIIVSEDSIIYLVQSLNRYEAAVVSIGRYNDTDTFVNHPPGETRRVEYKDLLLVGGINIPEGTIGIYPVDNSILEFVQRPVVHDKTKSSFYVVKQHDFSLTEYLVGFTKLDKTIVHTVLVEIDGKLVPTPALSDEDYSQVFIGAQLSHLRCVSFKSIELKDKKVLGLSWTPATKDTSSFPLVNVKIVAEAYKEYFTEHRDIVNVKVKQFLEKFENLSASTTIVLKPVGKSVCIDISNPKSKAYYCIEEMRAELKGGLNELHTPSSPSEDSITLSSEGRKSITADANPDDPSLPNIFEQTVDEAKTVLSDFAKERLNLRGISNVAPEKVLMMDGLAAVVENPRNRDVIYQYYDRLLSTPKRTLDTLSTEITSLVKVMSEPKDFALIFTTSTQVTKKKVSGLVIMLNGNVTLSRMFLIDGKSGTATQLSGTPPQAFLVKHRQGSQVGAIALGGPVFTKFARMPRSPTAPAKWWNGRTGVVFEFAGGSPFKTDWIQNNENLATKSFGRAIPPVAEKELVLATDSSSEYSSRVEEDDERAAQYEPDEPIVEILKDVIDEDKRIDEAVASVNNDLDLPQNSEAALLDHFLGDVAIDILASSNDPVEVKKDLDKLPETPSVKPLKDAVDAIVATDILDSDPTPAEIAKVMDDITNDSDVDAPASIPDSPEKKKPVDEDESDTFWDDQIKEWDDEERRELHEKARVLYLKLKTLDSKSKTLDSKSKPDIVDDFDEWFADLENEQKEKNKAQGKEVSDEDVRRHLYEEFLGFEKSLGFDFDKAYNSLRMPFSTESVSAPSSVYVLPKQRTKVTMYGGKESFLVNKVPLRMKTDPMRLTFTNVRGFYGTFDVVPTIVKGKAVVAIPLTSFSRFPTKNPASKIKFSSGLEKYEAAVKSVEDNSNSWIDMDNHGVEITFQKVPGTTIFNKVVITFLK